MKRSVINFINLVAVCCSMLFVSCVNQLESGNRSNSSKKSVDLEITFSRNNLDSHNTRSIISAPLDISGYSFVLQGLCNNTAGEQQTIRKEFTAEQYLRQHRIFVTVPFGFWKFSLLGTADGKETLYAEDSLDVSSENDTSLSFVFSGKGTAEISLYVYKNTLENLGITYTGSETETQIETMFNSIELKILLYDLEKYKNENNKDDISSSCGMTIDELGDWKKDQIELCLSNTLKLKDIPSGSYYLIVKLEKDGKECCLVQDNMYINPGMTSYSSENMMVYFMTDGGSFSGQIPVTTLKDKEKYKTAKHKFIQADSRYFPEKDKSFFQGWYLDKYFQKAFSASAQPKTFNTENLYLYAKWYDLPDINTTVYYKYGIDNYISNSNTNNLHKLPETGSVNTYKLQSSVSDYVFGGNKLFVIKNDEFLYSDVSGYTPGGSLSATKMTISAPLNNLGDRYCEKLYKSDEYIYLLVSGKESSTTTGYVLVVRYLIEKIGDSSYKPSVGWIKIDGVTERIRGCDFAVESDNLFLYVKNDASGENAYCQLRRYNFTIEPVPAADSNFAQYSEYIKFSNEKIKQITDIFTPVAYDPIEAVTGALVTQKISVNDMAVFGDSLLVTVGQNNIDYGGEVSSKDHLICTGEIIKLDCNSLKRLNGVGKIDKSATYVNSSNESSKIKTNLLEDELEYSYLSWPNRIVALDPRKNKIVFTDEGVCAGQKMLNRFVYFDLERFTTEGIVTLKYNFNGWNEYGSIIGFSEYEIKVSD